MVAVFCLQYSIGVGTKDSEHSEHQVYEHLLASERKYVSLFHPLSLLRREVSSSYVLSFGGQFSLVLYKAIIVVLLFIVYLSLYLDAFPHSCCS